MAVRYTCYFCGKSVTSELPNDAVIRALLVCPECIEAKEILIPDGAEADVAAEIATSKEPS